MLRRLTRGEFVHDDLEYRCYPLTYSLECDQFAPTGMTFIPLWEGESSITGFYVDNNRTHFITFSIEDIDDYSLIGTSIDALIDHLVQQYGDDEAALRKVLNE
ncbi:hypothetical protein GCM10007086_01330 [Photobacterium aphoticum]|uniref:Uncharacterized protein n=2 Tax=Photobacterium aphoticum TaxID=754436 RepID=A0A0J1JIG0_9GAMM|nr:hypothetical protein ABT58_04675 [Photobacterium aphoticum]PSU59318.1 hypothetical protein C9I90_04430 [Photobacterium aphoticum]GHA31945.1 hypothetical protein GCM10007086_01330 [Photobacterium aphoticum]